jgi:pimeloyl-ACP methyl ester carboxylesterase
MKRGMKIGLSVGISVLAILVAGGMTAGWWMVKRPLEVWAWGTRQTLTGAGLKRIVVGTPVGSQTVFVGGSGPVLVLLHGAGDQAGTWANVAPALVKQYTLVVPDLAGHGDSAPSTGPIETSAVFRALEAVIADQAGGRRVTIVGNSLGAWMAMVLAARHPDWVERVVAVNGGALKHVNTSVKLLPRNRAEARETMAQVRDAAAPPIPDAVLDDLVRLAKVGPIARFAATAASMEAWVLTEEQLRTLKVPVRLIWGASDQLMPLDYARRLEAALPDVKLVTLEHCGHAPQQEAPRRFLAALQGVLGEAPASVAPVAAVSGGESHDSR